MCINLYFTPTSVGKKYIPHPSFISVNHCFLPKVNPTKNLCLKLLLTLLKEILNSQLLS